MNSTRSLAAVLAGFLLTGLLSQTAWAKPDDPFFSYERRATYEVISEQDIQVPMRDGSYVVCDLYRPAKDGEVAPGRFPGIMSFDAYGYWVPGGLTAYADYFAPYGYNFLYCNTRGSGLGVSYTPGTLDVFSEQERRDNHDAVEWFANQPWSTGRIGQLGCSYGGITTYYSAETQPSGLVTIIGMDAPDSWYGNQQYVGGIRTKNGLAFANLFTNSSNLTSPPTRTYAEHPLYDDFWRERTIVAYPGWDKVKIPVLVKDGWRDLFMDSAPRLYDDLKNAWLLVGPWDHCSHEDYEVEPMGTNFYLAWFDHWLKKLPGAPLPRARVTSYEMPVGGTGWHQYSDWPPPDAQKIKLHFTSDRGLAARPGAKGEDSYVVNPLDGQTSFCFMLCAPNQDQSGEDASGEAGGWRLTYTTPPLSSDLVVTGNVKTIIRAAFSATDGNIFVRLEDVAPDGTATLVGGPGALKASHYKGHDHLETITPGEMYDLPVEVWATHWRFVKGHSLRLSVSSGDSAQHVPDPDASGIVAVATGKRGSFADLYVLCECKRPINAVQARSRSLAVGDHLE